MVMRSIARPGRKWAEDGKHRCPTDLLTTPFPSVRSEPVTGTFGDAGLVTASGDAGIVKSGQLQNAGFMQMETTRVAASAGLYL